VDKLQYYIQYLQKGKYYYEDVYGIAPFYIQIDKNKGQLSGTPIKIKFISESKFELSVDFVANPSKTLIHYIDNSRSQAPMDNEVFTKVFKIDEELNLPFLNGTIHLKPDAYGYAGKEYYIRFDDFNGTVGRYRGLDVSADLKAQSVVTLQIQGNNIHRLVEYLNETVNVLRKTQLDRKNQFATNTIRFIDSTLAQMEGQIKDAESELKDFRRGKNVFEIEGGGEMLTQKLSGYDVQKDELDRKLKYLNNLRSYLVKNSDFSRLPAPTVAGI